MVIDTHCHLNEQYYTQEAVAELLAEENLTACVTMGCSIAESQYAVNLAKNNEKVYACVGFHPENVEEFNGEIDIQALKNLAKQPKVVGIGETGLDYHYNSDYENHQKQKGMLVKLIDLANELKLPIVLHCRDAVEDMFKLLTENAEKLKNGFVLHCFCEAPEWVERFLKLGAYFSFAGNTTYKNYAVDAICLVPNDRILVETDSPYLSPVPKRGQKNVPANAEITGKFLANMRGQMWAELEQQLILNSKRFFKI